MSEWSNGRQKMFCELVRVLVIRAGTENFWTTRSDRSVWWTVRSMEDCFRSSCFDRFSRFIDRVKKIRSTSKWIAPNEASSTRLDLWSSFFHPHLLRPSFYSLFFFLSRRRERVCQRQLIPFSLYQPSSKRMSLPSATTPCLPYSSSFVLDRIPGRGALHYYTVPWCLQGRSWVLDALQNETEFCSWRELISSDRRTPPRIQSPVWLRIVNGHLLHYTLNAFLLLSLCPLFFFCFTFLWSAFGPPIHLLHRSCLRYIHCSFICSFDYSPAVRIILSCFLLFACSFIC